MSLTQADFTSPKHDAYTAGDSINAARKALVQASIECDLSGMPHEASALLAHSREVAGMLPKEWIERESVAQRARIEAARA